MGGDDVTWDSRGCWGLGWFSFIFFEFPVEVFVKDGSVVFVEFVVGIRLRVLFNSFFLDKFDPTVPIGVSSICFEKYPRGRGWLI